MHSALSLRSALRPLKAELKGGSAIVLARFIPKDLISIDICDNRAELLFSFDVG